MQADIDGDQIFVEGLAVAIGSEDSNRNFNRLSRFVSHAHTPTPGCGHRTQNSVRLSRGLLERKAQDECGKIEHRIAIACRKIRRNPEFRIKTKALPASYGPSIA
jgi:hypothetical protein